jgi:hypothetical protein
MCPDFACLSPAQSCQCRVVHINRIHDRCNASHITKEDNLIIYDRIYTNSDSLAHSLFGRSLCSQGFREDARLWRGSGGSPIRLTTPPWRDTIHTVV